MGNDGGSIPKRRELVKEAARAQTASELKESQQEAQTYAWRMCPVSQRKLQPPIVSDYTGTLYNKDAVLEYLLSGEDDAAAPTSKADAEKVFRGRVKGLKDVVDVKFQEQADAKDDEPRWVCPLTSKPLGPATKAAYIVPCGHAFAEAALREVSELVCLQCNESYTADNIVTILPAKADDRARLQDRMDKLRADGLSHSLKKAGGKKKRKNGDGETQAKHKAEEKTRPASQSSGLRNAGTASLTAKILAEEEAKAKRRKLTDNENLKSLYSSSEKRLVKDGDFMTRGFSIPANRKP